MSLITATMSALAAGAMWAVASLYSGHLLAGCSLLIATLLGMMMRAHGYARRTWAAIAVAALTMLASIYAGLLIATADVAMTLGLPLKSALKGIGVEMAVAVAWARADRVDLGIVVLAIVLSAALVAMPYRRSRVAS